jgi:hypothetical protein
MNSRIASRTCQSLNCSFLITLIHEMFNSIHLLDRGYRRAGVSHLQPINPSSMCWLIRRGRWLKIVTYNMVRAGSWKTSGDMPTVTKEQLTWPFRNWTGTSFSTILLGGILGKSCPFEYLVRMNQSAIQVTRIVPQMQCILTFRQAPWRLYWNFNDFSYRYKLASHIVNWTRSLMSRKPCLDCSRLRATWSEAEILQMLNDLSNRIW